MLHNSKYFSILLLLPYIIWGRHIHEVEKRDVCQERRIEREECVNRYKNNLGKKFLLNIFMTRAFETYKKSLATGDDGRPHWLARKGCNYLTSTVDHCNNLLVGSCHSKAEVNELQDKQIRGVLDQLETSIEAWDSDKCPPTR